MTLRPHHAQCRTRFSVESLEAREVPTFTLQVLHASDFEPGLTSLPNIANFAAIVDRLEDAHPNTIRLAGGDNYIPGPFFNAGGDPSLAPFLGTPSVGRADIEVLNRIGIDASSFGNHEFDAGPREVLNIIAPAGSGGSAWRGAQFPYLTSNVSFASPNDLAGRQTGPEQEASAIKGRIAPSAVITVNGEKIGLVGVTTPLLASISSPGPGTTVLPANPTDLDALAAVVQPAIDNLRNGPDNIAGNADDVNKIIVMGHLQQLSNEQGLLTRLRGVDIMLGAGSSSLLADTTDRLRPGDAAVGTYPIVSANRDGEPALLVNTDDYFTYLGRLVVTFDGNGVVVPGSVDPAVSGAYATDNQGVADVYAGSGLDPFGTGTKGAAVQSLVNAVAAVINTKDATQFGRTDVYLNGLRGEVRTQETNFGNLTADANLAAARAAGQPTVAVSLKNGGGIRDSIGSVGAVSPFPRLPPAANPAAGKEFGEVSLLDIENSLRFNNSLTTLSVTAADFRRIMEHSVAASGGTATPGQFPQVGGLAFSFDLTRTPIQYDTRAAGAGGTGALLQEGNRVRTLAIKDDAGNILDVIVKDGVVQGDPNRPIRLVTLAFLANVGTNPGLGGDNYPLPQYILSGSRVDLGVGEQTALSNHLAARYGGSEPYRAADVPPANDTRIQNLAVRADTVLEPAYVVPVAPGVTTEVIGTVGNTFDDEDGGDYRMVGIPDGMGAYDNGDGTFTLLMNHELPVGVANVVGGVGTASPAGLARDHGNAGGFVSRWVIRKSDLSVVTADDFLNNATSVFLSNNNPSTGAAHTSFLAAATTVMSRLCSADLAAPGAYVYTDPATGITYGTTARLFQSGEESGGIANGFTPGFPGTAGPEGDIHFGRQFAFVATDDPNTPENDARTAYELPHAGLFPWENNLASPFAQRKTIVAGMDDSTGGQLYFWVGEKQTTGNVVERAGLTRQSTRDNLYVLRVDNLTPDGTGATNESRTVPVGGRFSLQNEGDVSGLTFAQLETLSDTKGGTQFLRPEDGQWDPNNPNDYYFVTTDRYDQVKDGAGTQVGRSRLYRLRFDDITRPELGGTIEALLDGTEAGNMFDNMTIDRLGRVFIQEDVGNVAHNSKIWMYEIATDRLVEIAKHDPALFGEIGVAPKAPFTQDEESSGIIDVSDILGPGKFLINVQAHYNPGDAELVEGGQLLAMTVPVPAAVTGLRVKWGSTASRSVFALDNVAAKGIKSVDVVFDKDVTVSPTSLSLTGVNVPAYGLTFAGYNSATRTATWNLTAAGGVNIDRLTFSVSGVTDAVGNTTTYTKTLSVLPGDVTNALVAGTTGNNKVDATDLTAIRNRIALPYDARYDIDGDGDVDAGDYNLARVYVGKSAPTAPNGPSARGR